MSVGTNLYVKGIESTPQVRRWFGALVLWYFGALARRRVGVCARRRVGA